MTQPETVDMAKAGRGRPLQHPDEVKGKPIQVVPQLLTLATLGCDASATDIKRALREYAALVERATAELNLLFSREDWLYVADVLFSARYLSAGTESYTPRQFRDDLDDAHRLRQAGDRHYPKRPRESVNELVRKAETLSPLHVNAAVVAVRWLLGHSEEIDPKKDEWWTAEFRRKGIGE